MADIIETTGSLGKSYHIGAVSGVMPYGCADLNSWLETRKAGKHNARLKQLMKDCGCGTTEGYIRVTHAATLNDTFWVKSEEENTAWKDVSLYSNQFNDVISRLAFEGHGLYGLQMSGTSPELSTGGSFSKCWKREDDQIFLYKRGSEGAVNAGLEPYSEVLASEIASELCADSVVYNLVLLHGRSASKCSLFTSVDFGFLPYAMIPNAPQTASGMMSYYESLDAGDIFRRMCVLDALIINTDRHSNNHGVLFDNNTLEIKGPAPMFDFNLSLMPGEFTEDLLFFGRASSRFQPCIGDDFTSMAKSLLTPEIRADLINLKGFEFDFQGDERFPIERIRILEEMINHHIECILDQKTVYLSDAFPDPVRNEMKKTADDIRNTENISYANVEQENNSLFLQIGISLEDADLFIEYDERHNITQLLLDGENLTIDQWEEEASEKDRTLCRSVMFQVENASWDAVPENRNTKCRKV